MEPRDSLPYIDAEITQAERDAANRLIHKEIASSYRTVEHPSLPPLRETRLSNMLAKEISRHAAGQPRTGGIDTSRYEAPEEPSEKDDIAAWKSVLRNACVSSTYLSGRRTNLALLDEFGKNAWLMGNYELEGVLQRLEADRADIKMRTEEVNKSRKMAQEESRGELTALEESWKTGIGKTIEVQVATEQLRNQAYQRGRDVAG